MEPRFIPRHLGKALLATVLVVCVLQIADAQVMTSTNYKIQSDSVNVGGGNSTSTNYGLETTAGEVATGQSTSTNYQLRAGYQQMQEVFMSLSAVATINLTPNLGGISGGTSNGSTTVVVITDSPSGYQLTIKAGNAPAMQSGTASIADYVPVGAQPDFLFVTDPTDVQLGYSPEGVNVATRFRDNGSACGVGSGDILLRCWDGLATTAKAISTAAAANQPKPSVILAFGHHLWWGWPSKLWAARFAWARTHPHGWRTYPG